MLEFIFKHTPLSFMIQSLWRDEGFSWYMAKKPLIEIISITSKDFNPPFYYFLLHFWMAIFGSSEVALRSLSLVFFSLTIFVCYFFLRDILKIHGRRIYIYLIFFALNPFLVYYAFEVRMYSLVAFLALTSFYFICKRNWRMYILLTVLGLYTHYFFIGVVLTQVVFMVLGRKENILNVIKRMIIPFLFYLPWMVYSFPNLIKNTGTFWMDKVSLANIFYIPEILLLGYERSPYYHYYDGFLITITSIIWAIVLGLLIFNKNKKDPMFFLLSLWSFGFFCLIYFIAIFKPIFVSRYLIFSVVGFNIWLIYLINKSTSFIRGFVLLILFCTIFHYSRFQVKYNTKGDIRQTINEIKQLATDKDLLYVSDAGNYFLATYYFPEDRVFVYEDYQYIPAYIGIAALPKAKVGKQLPNFPRKGFILKSDYDYDIQTSL